MEVFACYYGGYFFPVVRVDDVLMFSFVGDGFTVEGIADEFSFLILKKSMVIVN